MTFPLPVSLTKLSSVLWILSKMLLHLKNLLWHTQWASDVSHSSTAPDAHCRTSPSALLAYLFLGSLWLDSELPKDSILPKSISSDHIMSSMLQGFNQACPTWVRQASCNHVWPQTAMKAALNTIVKWIHDEFLFYNWICLVLHCGLCRWWHLFPEVKLLATPARIDNWVNDVNIHSHFE